MQDLVKGWAGLCHADPNVTEGVLVVLAIIVTMDLLSHIPFLVLKIARKVSQYRFDNRIRRAQVALRGFELRRQERMAEAWMNQDDQGVNPAQDPQAIPSRGAVMEPPQRVVVKEGFV